MVHLLVPLPVVVVEDREAVVLGLIVLALWAVQEALIIPPR